jgi:molybdopterin/thiamine biosynthesis adenylyltransferase
MKNKTSFNYDEFTTRNSGYIEISTQKTIAETTLFIAGCGVGSTIAESAVRMGFKKFILADGDTVSLTNLNRQAFTFKDVGELKVSSLAKRLREINPNVEIVEHPYNLTPESAAQLVPMCDIICDTIDFLDLQAILNLHDLALEHKKPLISGVAAGWGSAAMYIANDNANELGGMSMIRHLFGVKPGEEKNKTYGEVFSGFFAALSHHFDESILKVMAKAFTLMEDGKPCPASQVVGGSYAVASLTMTILNQVLSEGHVMAAPTLLLVDNLGVVRNSQVKIQIPEQGDAAQQNVTRV